MDDPYDLERFVDAQNQGATYDRALEELRRGQKRSHWIWFVFPQIAGLGQSPTSRRFAISSLAEARAYLRHPVLRPRLIDCTAAIAGLQGRRASEILGGVDAQKLRSSMTLFHRAEPDEALFVEVVDRYFDGVFDAATDQRISGSTRAEDV